MSSVFEPQSAHRRRSRSEDIVTFISSSNTQDRPRDDSANKPHEVLAPIESESHKPPRRNLESSRSPPSSPAPLTATGLQNLRAEFKKEESSDIKHSDTLASRSIKKRAIGHGRSPSSSVRTTYSNDSSRRVLAKGVSPKRISSPPQQFTSLPKTQDPDETEIVRPPTSGKRLFEPDSDSPYAAPTVLASNTGQRPRSSHQQPQHRRNQSQVSATQRPPSGAEPGLFSASILANSPATKQETPPLEPPKIVRQPETRPISQEQLVAEVKGIYAGLVMVEGKCIQVDAKQAALAREAPVGTQPKLNNEQWQALIALHRTLLHEHHDFFLASQHPSATPAVRRLAIKYAMPARLWRHGIHSFLELLRNRLPDSLDHMLAFIYLAYSMMTLLYETVPAFEETWIECLGDLGRYRMAIEDDDIRDREVWTQVARQWYLKASDRSPETGRLYHHLAILARPNALQQLFFYYKALSVPQPFVAARESILTLFQPIVEGKQARRLPVVITAFVKVHAILFARKSQESFTATLVELSSHLDGHIGRVTQKYLEQGYYIAISNILALLENGLPNAVLIKALSEADAAESTDTKMSGTSIEADNNNALVFEGARQLFVQTVEIHLQRVGDPNILSFLHVTMVFMVYVSYSDAAMKLLDASFPWKELVTMLNTLLRFYHNYSRIESDLLPVPDKNDFRPTPEEFALRGLFWTVRYFIPGWFRNKNIEDENQYKEDASMNTDYRPERILWLGCQLAKSGMWICYNREIHKFFMPGSEKTMDTVMEPATPSELELDSGNESTTDTATLMADCDDTDIEGMSFASRSSTGLSEKVQGQESKWGIQTSSTWTSEQTQEEEGMEVEEGSVSTTMDNPRENK